MGDEVDFLDSQLVQDCGEVAGLRGLFVSALGMGRQAHATQVGNGDGMGFHQPLGQWHPHIAGITEAMEQ